MLSEKRCECFDEIVEEVLKRIFKKGVADSEQIIDSIQKGILDATAAAVRSIRDTDGEAPECSAD